MTDSCTQSSTSILTHTRTPHQHCWKFPSLSTSLTKCTRIQAHLTNTAGKPQLCVVDGAERNVCVPHQPVQLFGHQVHQRTHTPGDCVCESVFVCACARASVSRMRVREIMCKLRVCVCV